MSYIGKGVEVVTFNTATTLDVAGNITVGGTVDGRDVATDGTKLDTIAANAIANLSEDTTPQLGGNLDLNTSNIIGTGNINVTGSITGTSFVSTGDMSFTNNSKAIFGTSPSLEIYHNGSNSILDDVGAGNFKMQLAGADKLEITSTGVDVTGTVTADGLTVDGDVTLNDGSPNLRLQDTDVSRFGDISYGTRVVSVTNTMASGEDMDTVQPWMEFRFKDDGETREVLRLNYNGNVGIGTSSPSDTLEVSNNSNYQLRLSSAGQNYQIGRNGSDGLLYFYGNQSGYTGYVFSGVNGERMRIDSSGKIKAQTAGGYYLTESSTDAYSITCNGANGFLAITDEFNSAERLRIDSSGNLLVGTTSTTLTGNAGFTYQGGITTTSNNGSLSAIMNRNTNDGEIVQFRKDNTTVGSIGTTASDLCLTSNNVGFRMDGSNNHIIPVNDSLTTRDAAIDLGYSGGRFKDLYLSGNAQLGNGYNLSWGGSYSSGYPTVYATNSSGGYIAFAPNGNAPSANQVRIVGDGIEFGAASSNLNDYEEGTWTPVILMDSGTSTVSAYGRYVKTGMTVYATFYAQFTAAASSPTVNSVANFPFVQENSGTWAGVGSVRENSQTGYQWHVRMNNNSTNALLRRYDNQSSVAVNYVFIGSITYTTP